MKNVALIAALAAQAMVSTQPNDTAKIDHQSVEFEGRADIYNFLVGYWTPDRLSIPYIMPG
jgi:hypothetical protein